MEEYRQAAARLRRAVPGMALTTDAIVGFPTESEGDFEATRAFMDEMGFDNAFVFKYSPRPGTPAEALPDDVPAAEKLRRNKVLLADQDRRRRESNRRLVGTGVEVLVEGVSARNAARWSGRTRSNQIVVFEPSPGVAVGDLVRANVSRATPQTLYAEV